MKKAKIILTSLALLAIVGGALAFKANRALQSNIWYIPTVAGVPQTTITTTLFNGQIYSTTIINCTKTALASTNIGPLVNTSTYTTNPLTTTVFTRQVSPGVTASFTTTYHFCTPVVTRVTAANS